MTRPVRVRACPVLFMLHARYPSRVLVSSPHGWHPGPGRVHPEERGSGDRCLPVSLRGCAGGEKRRPTGRYLPRSGSSYVPALGPWEVGKGVGPAWARLFHFAERR